jgi:hypothetical protein
MRAEPLFGRFVWFSVYGGAVMPRIEFRGKTYRNELEMPREVREAYNQEKERRRQQRNTASKPLTDIVDMSPEVKAIYERALGNVDDKLTSPQRSRDLPKTEDIYRQSAPDDMKHLPSDESIYRPSQPLIDPAKSVIEPESAFGMKRFVSSLIWALILAAVAFIIWQFLL